MRESMEQIIANQEKFFQSGQTKSVAFRKAMLIRLYKAVKSHEGRLYSALKMDLNKSESEAYLTEIQIVLAELREAVQKLDQWDRPQKVKTPISHYPASSRICQEPYGKVLILSPWNYPVQLSLAPLVGAIAGGNCAVLKTSKSSRNVSRVIRHLIEEAFPRQYICCVSMEYSYEEILSHPYDFLFFTGSERVGKQVMESAAKNLTPLILELGGKSPCIIEKTADLKLAARRIAWGKFLNAGQTCVAPDYILIDESVEKVFLQELKRQLTAMYGNALENQNYPRIINTHHMERLTAHISCFRQHAAEHSGKAVLVGGRSSRESCCIEPTIFTGVTFEDEIMQEEIFGPILPVIAYSSLSTVEHLLKNRAKPLALYLFSEDKPLIGRLMRELPFGGGCVNDVIMHLANHHLPFGGVGSSGMGSYHGVYSYLAFTRSKSILEAKSFLDLPLRYPPYTDRKLALIKKIVERPVRTN